MTTLQQSSNFTRFIAEEYGKRCFSHNYTPRCTVCAAWKLYDNFLAWLAKEPNEQKG